jgi:hypothetical protein
MGDHSMPMRDHSPAKPCQGPNCSHKPAPVKLPIPPSTTVITFVEEWIGSLLAMPQYDSASLQFQRAEGEGEPLWRTRSIFHPPRI